MVARCFRSSFYISYWQSSCSWRVRFALNLKAQEKLLKDFVGTYATGEVYMIAVATERFKMDMSKFPTLSRIYESQKALPEFLAASPERQPDALH